MLASPAWAAPAPACSGTVEAVRVLGVESSGEFRLDDGRVLRLASLRVADDQPARAVSWLGTLVGRAGEARVLGVPDRWNRVAASLVVDGVDPGEVLVGQGWAALDADGAGRFCRPDLRAAEASARRRRLGVWAAETWPLAAADLATLTRHVGRFAVIEGRVVSVGVRRDRTFLNFGRDWNASLSATVPAAIWAGAAARGLDAASLTGHRVRVRGIVEMRRGPTVEVTALDMLELVEETAGQP